MSSPSHSGPLFFTSHSSNIGLTLMHKMGYQQGKGLGKSSTGATEYIKTKTKNNNEGIGCKETTAEEMFKNSQAVFNDVLSRLKEEGTGKEKKWEKEEEETVETTYKKMSARTAMYRKFKKGKNLSNYTEAQKNEILGTSQADIDNAKRVAEVRKETNTTTSTTSIGDYFAKKLAEKAGTDTTRSKFQVAEGQGFSISMQEKMYENMINQSQTNRRGIGSSSNSMGGGLGFTSNSSFNGAGLGMTAKSVKLEDDDDVPKVPKSIKIEEEEEAEETENERKQRKADKKARKLLEKQQEEQAELEKSKKNKLIELKEPIEIASKKDKKRKQVEEVEEEEVKESKSQRKERKERERIEAEELLRKEEKKSKKNKV